ncbi:MAG: hypothetical protein ACK5MT_11705 [Actinomycetales bacterium]
MGIKQEGSTFLSSLDIGSIRQILRQALGPRVEISPLEFDVLDDPPDLAVLAQRYATFGAQSAIQIYVNDEGSHRSITLVALGDGAFGRMMGASNGMMNNGALKLSGGRKMVAEVESALRQQDSSLTTAG